MAGQERDVISAIAAVHPDVVMIELDEERLEFMRGPGPRPTLQQFHYTVDHGSLDENGLPTPSTSMLVAQRAYWNGEFAEQQVSGPIVLHSGDSRSFSSSVRGSIVVTEVSGW
eukprot:Skav214410  [mRNA]  locus=scaffold586:41913:44445:+ [translate_table: standard]